MVDRLSTNLIYNLLGSNVIGKQNEIFKLSKQINSGKKFVSPDDDPVGIIGSIDTQGRIKKNDQSIRDRNTLIADLEAQEVAISTINDITDRVHEIAVAGASDTMSGNERRILRDELRSLGETIVQLVNSKNGDKYIFSGQQSNLQTLRLDDGASFGQVVYKHNQDNGQERLVNDIRASVSLKDALVNQASTAVLTNNKINPVASTAGDLVFEVNDGNDNVYNFTASIASGDDLSTVISKINTAFTGSGGSGSIATESPSGYLKLDTANITGNLANSSSKISLKSSSTKALTNELGVSTKDYFGKEKGLLQTLADLETALSNNDSTTIRNSLNILTFNSRQLNSVRSDIGLLVAQSERLNTASDDLDIKLQSDLSIVQDIDMIDANIQLANSQSALQTAIQITSSFFSRSLSDFLR